MKIPEIGSIFKFDGIHWTVVGGGSDYFEYKAEKGIFSLIDLEIMDCLALFIEEKNVIITIDPMIPSVKVNDKEILGDHGHIGNYVLLKYEREYN